MSNAFDKIDEFYAFFVVVGVDNNIDGFHELVDKFGYPCLSCMLHVPGEPSYLHWSICATCQVCCGGLHDV